MIVIPMAGLSARFTRAGYDRPKYMLPLHGRTVFAHAVGSFAAYAASEPFLFIVRDIAETPDFVRQQAEALGLGRFHVAVLDAPTRGQADTVAIGLDRAGVADAESLTIFNIDTFRPGFRFPFAEPVDGYLEVFEGSGVNWSYVRPLPGDKVAETAEKRPISNLCCTGLYYFAAASLYRDAFQQAEAAVIPGSGLGEIYVAPLYNVLIATGKDVRYHIVPRADVIFCGVPEEYQALLATPATALRTAAW